MPSTKATRGFFRRRRPDVAEKLFRAGGGAARAVDGDHHAGHGARLADALHQVGHALVAGDEAVDGDPRDMGLAGDAAERVSPRHNPARPTVEDEGEDSEHAPETELAAQPAAVGDGFCIDGHVDLLG